MDIHRSRFVPFPSSPINAVAFSRSSDKGLSEPKPALKLAVGRANGDIEIWNPANGAWVQEVVFSGGEKKSIDALVWTQEPDDNDYEGKPILGQLRLFSIGSTAAVTEWNLGTGRPLRASTGNFSEVWCFAAQTRWRQNKASGTADEEYRGQNLVAGCGDGTLAVLSTADNDLVFQRFLARAGSRKTRCMSVIWQNRERIVAGFTDSNIRVYDARNGSLLRNMSLGAGMPGAPRDTLVWRIKCLPNGDIVSADSNGEVRFWDGRTYSLTQRVSGHESDCLEVITSTDGQTVFSGGMDGKIATYKLGGREGQKSRWAKTGHRRIHEGDVKSMAVHDSKALSVVVSGGLDASPTVLPLRAHGKELHRKLPGLPQHFKLVSAPYQRLLVSWWDRHVYIWRIGEQQLDAFAAEDRNRRLVGRITVKGAETISSVAISEDGRLLAVATPTSTKLFQLRPSRDANDDRLRVRTMEVPESLSGLGGRLLAISPDGHWLSVVSQDNDVVVARIRPEQSDSKRLEALSKVAELERAHRKLTQQSGLKSYERTITRLAFSPDSSVLVAGDLTGFLDTWVLEGHFDSTAPATDLAGHDSAAGSSASASSSDTDSSDEEDANVIFYGQHWTEMASSKMLPKLDSAPLVLSFRPSASSSSARTGNPGVHPTRHNPHAHSHSLPVAHSLLLVVTQNHNIYEFDTLSGRLTEWSRRNPTSVLPPEIKSIKDRVMGVVWDAQSLGKGDRRGRAWIYGSSWLAMLDVSQDFTVPSRHKGNDEPTTNGAIPSTAMTLTDGKKRRRSEVEKWEMREEKRRKQKGTNGAGDRVAEDERGGVASIAVRTSADGTTQEIDLDAVGELQRNGDDDDDDMAIDGMDDEDNQTLGPLRRITSNEDEADEADDSSDRDTAAAAAAAGSKRRKWWCTYKYRPILGMVPIGVQQQADVADGEVDGSNPLEVVLVERPPWDLEQMQELKGRRR